MEEGGRGLLNCTEAKGSNINFWRYGLRNMLYMISLSTKHRSRKTQGLISSVAAELLLSKFSL